MANKSFSSIKIFFVLGVLLFGALLLYKANENSNEPKVSKILNQNMTAAFSGSSIQKKEKVSVETSLQQTPANLSSEDQKKWNSLREILISKNDNDPRMDRDLKNLSESFHQELMKEYNVLPMENRNERGLIAFLIARDLKSAKDLEFLKTIYEESPCLSLENCSTRSTGGDPHHSGLDQASMNYPQMAVLYQLDKQLAAANKILEDSVVRDQMKQALSAASRFPVPMVQKKAEQIQAAHNL